MATSSTPEPAQALGDPIGDEPRIAVHLQPVLTTGVSRWATLPPEAGFIAQLGKKSLVRDLKNQLCDKLGLANDCVQFMHAGQGIDDAKTLGENEGVVLPGASARKAGKMLEVMFDATGEHAASVKAANDEQLQEKQRIQKEKDQRLKEEEIEKRKIEEQKKKERADHEKNKDKIAEEERRREEAEKAAGDLATKRQRLNSLPREIRVVEWDAGWVNFVGDRFGELRKLVNDIAWAEKVGHEGYTIGDIIDEASFWGVTGKLIQAFSHDVLPEPQDFPIVIVFGGVPDKGPVFQQLAELKLQAADAKTVAAHAEPKDSSMLCGICFCNPGTVVLSGSCPATGSESKHYYCAECARHCFDAMRETGSGQFPMYCVGCRAAWPNQQCPGGEETVGRIEAQDVALLESLGVIDSEMALRVLKLHNDAINEPMMPFMQCPGKCGRHLLLDDPSYTQQLRPGGRVGNSIPFGWLNNGSFVTDAINLGQCECGASMCVKCGEAAEPGHRCNDGELSRTTTSERNMIAKAYEGFKTARQCPGCGHMVEKNAGCDYMMCGTEAHGKLQDALANGGCACTFLWNTGEPCQSPYIDLDNKQTSVFPVNDRQVFLIGTKWHARGS